MKTICKNCGKEINKDNKLNGKRHHASCMIKMITNLRNKGEVKK